ncbi:MAG TPA: MFS transporter [Roseiarcus sp.]|nr:MFS transporter [Roseiarcus sp.]
MTILIPVRRALLRDIPAGVWALGFVSLLMDISSEMIHALLPIYLLTVINVSPLAIGAFEGVAESTASTAKVFSGVLSDWLGNRKALAAIGYGLAAFTRPIFPLAPTIGWLAAARFVDRAGKGIRGAPRDALVADISPPQLRGASFGLRQSLDTIGSFLGPLIAIALMWSTGNNFRAVFWVAVIPAFMSFALVLTAVREPNRAKSLQLEGVSRRPRFELRRLGAPTLWVAAVAAVFALARFSEAFLVLRGQSIGLSPMLAPATLVFMNIAYSASALPVGILSDRFGRVTILMIGLLLLTLADVVLAVATSVIGVGAGVALWGLHMGFTQGMLATLVADTAPPELRGTAFGLFHLVTGAATLLASVIAGALWQMAGPEGAFLAGAAFALLTLAGLLPVRRRMDSVGLALALTVKTFCS